jgi:DNA-binding transcriptional ArsR family regulator
VSDHRPMPPPDAAQVEPGAEADPEVVRLDAAGLAALAHPLRSRLVGALRMEGPATATGLAQRLGTNSGATSYHLRQLAEAGLVEEDAERGDGRSRYWRASHRSTRWSDLDFDHDPDDRANADWLLRATLRQHTRWAEDWLDERSEWPESWRSVADTSDFRLRLTPDQLEAYVAEVHAVAERYRQLNPPDAPGTEQVLVVHRAFPAPRPSL